MTMHCLEFIKEAHDGQTYGEAPYWTHPVEVERVGRETFNELWNESAALTALLHDVIEDTHYDRDDLLAMGYCPAVVEAVELVTKDPTLSYRMNIARIAHSGNLTAMMVKYADNKVNASTRKESIPDYADEKMKKKYSDSMGMLKIAIELDVKTNGVKW
jgi:(p)ppGpp synthase/HD superfamily hydrolase